jgi:hypothetical protein
MGIKWRLVLLILCVQTCTLCFTDLVEKRTRKFTRIFLLNMPRFHGRVKTFFINQGYGHLVELGETGRGTRDNVINDRDVYFHVTDMSLADPSVIVPKATTGDIVEYERVTDEKGRHQATNITGLYGTRLACEEGLIVFKRYSDLHREMLRREGERAVSEYVNAQSRTFAPKQKRARRNQNRRKHSSFRGGGRDNGRSDEGGGGYAQPAVQATLDSFQPEDNNTADTQEEAGSWGDE